MFRPSLPLEKERKHSLQLVLPELHTPGSPNENICLYIYARLGGWRRRYTLAKRGSSRKTRSEFLFCVCGGGLMCVHLCWVESIVCCWKTRNVRAARCDLGCNLGPGMHACILWIWLHTIWCICFYELLFTGNPKEGGFDDADVAGCLLMQICAFVFMSLNVNVSVHVSF